MSKKNCWEVKNCGREPGGAKVAELGVCPAATNKSVNGLNGGKNGGRTCWYLAGTFCGGQVQGSMAQKLANCMDCEFFKMVAREEKSGLVDSKTVLAKMTYRPAGCSLVLSYR